MSRFGKVRPGEGLKIPAGDWNGAMDAARAHAMSQLHRLAPELQNAPTNRDVVLVRNDSGSDVGRFGVLGLDAPVFEPADSPDPGAAFANQPAMAGVTPADPDTFLGTRHLGRFVITLEPIAAGKFGLAVLSGLAQAYVNIVDPEHTGADILDGDLTKLGSTAIPGPGAAQILWQPGTAGDKWCLVRLNAGTRLPAMEIAYTNASGGAFSVQPAPGLYLLLAVAAGGGGGEKVNETKSFTDSNGDTLDIPSELGGGGGGGGASLIGLYRTDGTLTISGTIGLRGEFVSGSNGTDGGDTIIEDDLDMYVELKGGAGGRSGPNGGGWGGDKPVTGEIKGTALEWAILQKGGEGHPGQGWGIGSAAAGHGGLTPFNTTGHRSVVAAFPNASGVTFGDWPNGCGGGGANLAGATGFDGWNGGIALIKL